MSRSSRTMRGAIKTILRVILFLACALAIFYGIILTVDIIKSDMLRVWQLHFDGFATRLLPRTLAGLYVFPLPTGGVLRGDYLIVVIIAIAAAWGASRVAKSTR